MKGERCIAIIPARNDDRIIPQRNILPFCGEPIISYSIKAALESGLFDEVMVSTDSELISKVAREYGASAPFLRSSPSGWHTETTDEVLYNTLVEYSKMGIEFDVVCCIYPIAPFVTRQKLISTYNILQRAKADAIIPITSYPYPPQRCFVLQKNGRVKYKWPKYRDMDSSEIEPVYRSAGQYQFVRKDALFREKTAIPQNTISFMISSMEQQDLRNTYDWKIAEYKFELLKGIQLRKAQREDVKYLFEWRNNIETRKNSFQQDIISWDSHVAWFDRVIDSSESSIYVLTISDIPVGQVRLNYLPDFAEISYTIGPEYRGRGYGSMLLKLAENQVVEDRGNIKLKAEVLKHNIASRKVFLSLGYDEEEKEKKFEYVRTASYSDLY